MDRTFYLLQLLNKIRLSETSFGNIDFLDGKMLSYLQHISHVIGIGMSQDQYIQTSNTTTFEIGN